MTDSSNDELEKLKKQRAELESKLVAVRKNRNVLEDETGVLEETVAIRELEEELKEEEDAVAKFTLKRGELKNKLKAPKEFATSGITQKSGAKINVGELEDKLKLTKEFATSGITQKSGAETKDKIDKPETDEQTRVIWKRDEQTPENAKPQEDESKESEEKQEKKKKLRFF